MSGAERPGRTYGGVPAETRRRERRTRLVEAGLELFGTRGFVATSIDDVCTTAGVNKRYFYESFANLDELFIAVYQEVNGRIETAVLAAMLRAGGDVVVAAAAGVEAFFAYLAEHREAARVFSFEIAGRLSDERVQQAASDAVQPWRRLLRGVVGDEPLLGLAPDTAVTMAWSLITGVTVQWALGGFSEPVEELTHGVTTVLGEFLVERPAPDAS